MSIDTDYATLRKVFTEYQPRDWAVEFGVYSGYSLRIIAEHMPVIGFDSFDGLPEDWRPGFPKGKFAVRREGPTIKGKPFVVPNNAMVVEGLFEHTAPEFPFPPLGLVHIDCDLYSSTVTALEAVEPYIDRGTIIVFDEFQGYEGYEEHEQKAWFEFRERRNVDSTILSLEGQEMSLRIDHIEHS